MSTNDSKSDSGNGGLVEPVKRRLFDTKGLKALGRSALWMGTFIALFYAIENYRGHSAWGEARRKLEAAGIPYEYRSIIPKPVPDEQNFGALPIVTNWFAKKSGEESAKPPPDYFQDATGRIKKLRTRVTEAQSRTLIDLPAWARAFETRTNLTVSGPAGDGPEISPTAQDLMTPVARAEAAPVVLAAMDVERARFDALREGLQRPYCRYPVDYSSENAFAMLLPHLSRLKDLSQRLQLHGSAELAAGNPAGALADVRLMFGLGDTLKGDHILISHLVRIAIWNLALQVVWEGLQEHRWSPQLLEELGQMLAGGNFVAELEVALNGERAGAISVLDYCRRNHNFAILNQTADSDQEGTPGPSAFGRLVPNGWYLMEMASYSRRMDGFLAGIDPAGGRVNAGVIKAGAQAITDGYGGGFWGFIQLFMRHELAVRALMPAMVNTGRLSAAAQAGRDEARIACAIERLRIANGSIPESLDALKPFFPAGMPVDPINGGAYHFKPQGDTYVLYSVAWDEKDDGGKPATGLTEKIEGDWTWGWMFRR